MGILTVDLCDSQYRVGKFDVDFRGFLISVIFVFFFLPFISVKLQVNVKKLRFVGWKLGTMRGYVRFAWTRLCSRKLLL